MAGKLQQVLDQMYRMAYQRAAVPQKRKLKMGLHISLTSFPEGVTLIISRDETYPSPREFETVLKNFPYFTGAVHPVQVIDQDGRRALTGKIPPRAKVLVQAKLE